MAISDKRQRVMPTAKDRRNAQPLDYPEAVRFSRPGNPSLKGEVGSKFLDKLRMYDIANDTLRNICCVHMTVI